MTRQDRAEAIEGVRAILPLALGVAVYGLAFGLLASQAGFSWVETGVMGAAVLAGASQIVAVERLAAGAGIVAALVAGVVLNLRLLLITASVRELFAGRPLWQRVLGAHLSTDENWALTVEQRSRGREVGYWFLVGGGAALLVAWVSSSALGVIFASWVPEPETYALDFAFTAAFIAICRALWRGKSDLLPWAVAVATVVVSTRSGLLDPSWSILLGGVAGACVAAWRRDV